MHRQTNFSLFYTFLRLYLFYRIASWSNKDKTCACANAKPGCYKIQMRYKFILKIDYKLFERIFLLNTVAIFKLNMSLSRVLRIFALTFAASLSGGHFTE